jgi:hypothetical protein
MSRAFSAGKLKAEERRAILQAIESQMQQVIIDGVTMVLQEFLEQEVTTKLGRAIRSPRRISSQARPIDCVISTIQDNSDKASGLWGLVINVTQAGQWAEAERVIDTIQDSFYRTGALHTLCTALTQARQWTEAERVIDTIQDMTQQAVASNTLATMIASTDKLEQVLHFIQRSWRQAVTRDEAFTLFSGAITVIPRISDIGTAFQSAFSWVDNFLNG